MNRLRELRKEKGLTLEDVSERLEITSMSLSRYERGEREPKGEILFKLAKMYEVTPDYLLGWTEERNDNQNKILDNKDVILISIYDEVKELTDSQKEEILNVIKSIKKMRE